MGLIFDNTISIRFPITTMGAFFWGVMLLLLLVAERQPNTEKKLLRFVTPKVGPLNPFEQCYCLLQSKRFVCSFSQEKRVCLAGSGLGAPASYAGVSPFFTVERICPTTLWPPPLEWFSGCPTVVHSYYFGFSHFPFVVSEEQRRSE